MELYHVLSVHGKTQSIHARVGKPITPLAEHHLRVFHGLLDWCWTRAPAGLRVYSCASLQAITSFSHG